MQSRAPPRPPQFLLSSLVQLRRRRFTLLLLSSLHRRRPGRSNHPEEGEGRVELSPPSSPVSSPSHHLHLCLPLPILGELQIQFGDHGNRCSWPPHRWFRSSGVTCGLRPWVSSLLNPRPSKAVRGSRSQPHRRLLSLSIPPPPIPPSPPSSSPSPP